MAGYVLTAPMIITSRLMPGVRVGGVTISIAECDVDDPGGLDFRKSWQYFIDGEGLSYSAQDLDTPHFTDVRHAMATLLGFLGADAESYVRAKGGRPPEDGWLFDQDVAEWAYQCEDELWNLRTDLEGGSVCG